MNKIKKLNKVKGSGIIMVVLSSIAFSIYLMSTYAEQEHLNILQNKYEKDMIAVYEKNNSDIESFYQQVLEKMKE